MKRVNSQNNQQGYMIILTMIIVFVLMGTGLTIASTVAANYASTKRATYVDSAISVAEAGVSDTISRIKSNSAFAGYPDTDAGRKEFYSSPDRGRAEYTTAVTSNADGTKTIRSTGYVYSTQDAVSVSGAANNKTIEVALDTKQVGITPDIFVGYGGMRMSSYGSIRTGNVYVGGNIALDSTANLGSTSTTSRFDVANYGCGDDTNWPQLCTTQAITTTYIGPYGADVYGPVCATGQNPATSGFIKPGSGGVGLINDCVASPIITPMYDKKAFIEGINPSKRSGSDFKCGFVGSTITIPANTWIDGDLDLDGNTAVGTCRVIIEGNLYIEGDMIVGTRYYTQLADSLGTARPTIALNGTLLAYGSVNRMILPNSSNNYAYVISFASTNSACSASTTVPSSTQSTCLTNAQARASSNPLTGSKGLHCRWGVGGNKDMTGAVFYAYYGIVSCAEQGADFRAVGAQGLHLGFWGAVGVSPGSSPFQDILTVPTYKVISYRQLY